MTTTTTATTATATASAIICPSMLSCDFSQLASEAQRMLNCGADWLHMDVMDGHFVPNITIGPVVVKSLRANVNADTFLDCHLMVTHPLQWIEPFAKAGANQISYHFETQQTMEEHRNVIEAIKAQNMKVSIAIKPGTDLLSNLSPKTKNTNTNTTNDSTSNPTPTPTPTPIEVIKHFIADLNQVLIMTVEPGFGGQKFMSNQMSKVSYLRNAFPSLNIQVDGGVNIDTIDIAAKAGANVIVSGSGVFKHSSCPEAIASLRKTVNDYCAENTANST